MSTLPNALDLGTLISGARLLTRRLCVGISDGCVGKVGEFPFQCACLSALSRAKMLTWSGCSACLMGAMEQDVNAHSIPLCLDLGALSGSRLLTRRLCGGIWTGAWEQCVSSLSHAVDLGALSGARLLTRRLCVGILGGCGGSVREFPDPRAWFGRAQRGEISRFEIADVGLCVLAFGMGAGSSP